MSIGKIGEWDMGLECIKCISNSGFKQAKKRQRPARLEEGVMTVDGNQGRTGRRHGQVNGTAPLSTSNGASVNWKAWPCLFGAFSISTFSSFSPVVRAHPRVMPGYKLQRTAGTSAGTHR